MGPPGRGRAGSGQGAAASTSETERRPAAPGLVEAEPRGVPTPTRNPRPGEAPGAPGRRKCPAFPPTPTPRAPRRSRPRPAHLGSRGTLPRTACDSRREPPRGGAAEFPGLRRAFPGGAKGHPPRPPHTTSPLFTWDWWSRQPT